MLPTTSTELSEAFSAANNLNAALKNFLKREGNNGAQVVAFAKDFRNAVSGGRSAAIQFFIEKNYPGKEMYFMGVARYAFPEVIESTVSEIIEKYAEDFNATYVREEQGITVKDSKAFGRIVSEVKAVIESRLRAAEVPTNNFMQNSLLASVFEVDVLAEVMKVLV